MVEMSTRLVEISTKSVEASTSLSGNFHLPWWKLPLTLVETSTKWSVFLDGALMSYSKFSLIQYFYVNLRLN